MKSVEIVDRMMNDLRKFREVLTEMDNLEDRRTRSKAECESMEEKAKIIKNELDSATAGLARAQVDNQRRYEQEMFTKQGELRDLNERVGILKMQLTELNVAVTNKGNELAQINSSLAEVKRKFAL
jgi:chromosome segregation ATPase